MKDNNAASTIAGVAFGLFCLFAVIAAIIYIAAISTQQSPITDTYGNTLSPTTNNTQETVTALANTGESSVVPLLLLAGVVFVCAVLFLAWVVSKSGISI